MAKKNKRTKQSSSGAGTIAALIAGGVALAAGLVALARRSRAAEGGSSAADLALGKSHGPGDRANIDFRPDPTAPVPKSRRDAMAPATMPNPMNAEPTT